MWNLLAEVLSLVKQLFALESELWVLALHFCNLPIDNFLVGIGLGLILMCLQGEDNGAIWLWFDTCLGLVD